MKYGIAIIALGNELYGSCAFNLALSLKVYDPAVQICVMHDGKALAHLTAQELAYFDTLVMVPPEMYMVGGKPQYQRAKLCLDTLSPYHETMYMDADDIWFDRPVSWLYGEVCHTDFHISINGHYSVATGKRTTDTYTYWWKNLAEVCSYWGIAGVLPQTVSGWFFFRKSEQASLIFAQARRVYDDKNAPCQGWGGGRPDEYCFNVALGLVGYTQAPRHVFFFSKLHGHMASEQIYLAYWGLANGGAIVDAFVIVLYNRLVNKYCTRMGITTRHYHIDKARVIESRQ